MTKVALGLIAPVVLCACGGTSVTVDPIAQAGFAGAAGADINQVNTYVLTDQTLLRRVDDGLPSLVSQTVELVGALDSETVTLRLNGRTFDLAQNPDDLDEFSFRTDDITLFIEGFDQSPSAVAFNLFFVEDGTLIDGYFIAGFDTNPTAIASESGTATFTGSVDASLRTSEFDDAFGSGTATMTANFDDMTLTGSATIAQDDPENADYTFPDLTLGFVETDITANGFAGNLEYDDGDRGGSLISGNYNGRFFGEQGETLGGNFSGQIAVEAFRDDIFMTGYFLADKVDN